MAFPDIIDNLTAAMPALQGRMKANAVLGEFTWFRVGGPAQVLFTPSDEADLAYFRRQLPTGIPLVVIGLASNLLVRDGGIPGVVVRLGRGFGHVVAEQGARIRAGTGVPDVRLARAAADAGIAGLEFYRGIPGGLGGALRMNAGAHGTETKDRLASVRAVTAAGDIVVLTVDELNYRYRHCGAPEDLIFTEATFAGEPGCQEKILDQMQDVADYRETHQPTRDRTGGSTFKNPDGHSAWRLIDAAGCRGLRVGGAHVSEKHCNFLINDGLASAEDLEILGETVRARVMAKSGIQLEWEIKRLGLPIDGHETGSALALDNASRPEGV